MSYDLAVWHTPRPSDKEHAVRILSAIAEHDGSQVKPHPAFDAFMAEITTDYRELHLVPEDEIDDCPWNTGPLDRVDGGAYLTIAWSRAEEMHEYVLRIAAKHGLVVYDLQADETIFPEPQPDSPTKGKPWWRFW